MRRTQCGIARVEGENFTSPVSALKITADKYAKTVPDYDGALIRGLPYNICAR
jgi:hypothetical protein